MAVVINGITKFTYKEYVQFPQDGRRHELIDGDHYVTPAPETAHQRTSRLIQFQLMQQIELVGRGEVYDAPTDLQFSETDVVQPDLIVVLTPRRQIITPKKIKGVPDLVVEISSPSTSLFDRGIKKELYQRSGVPEYWIVDIEEHAVEQYLLEGGSYQLAAREEHEICFRQLPGVAVDLRKVW